MIRLHDQRGAAATEMAMVLPIFVMLAFGLLEGGRYYSTHNAITHAAREAARVVALGGSASSATTRVAAAGVAGATVATTTCPSSIPAGSTPDAKVTVTKPFTFNIPFVAVSLPGGGISSTAVMRCNG
jgi:Flp pilus assembly protein TadG